MKSKKKYSPLRKKEILQDYRLAIESRECSYIGRKEVFMGKAKFGIFGDGKEVPQLAMAKVFRNGDFRSGYYRDQTFMMAIGQLSSKQFFAQLYADTDEVREPASAGRSMNGHFGSRSLDKKGNWKNLLGQKNSSPDVSPTASQMPRLVGLAYASKVYKEVSALAGKNSFSNKGQEVAFGTIGNASTSEGMFFESINSAGVLQIPMLISIWDDDYGISVPKKYHTAGGDIGRALEGMRRNKEKKGIEILKVKGWDYEACIETYKEAERICRKEHVPVVVHVEELTQPQGHSTSGSHERYKSKERLKWEQDFDCLRQMKLWIQKEEILSTKEIVGAEKEGKENAKKSRSAAWAEFLGSMLEDNKNALSILKTLADESADEKVAEIFEKLKKTLNPIRLDCIKAIKKAVWRLRARDIPELRHAKDFIKKTRKENWDRYSSHLYSESEKAALKISEIAPKYGKNPKPVDGREVIQSNFEAIFKNYKEVFAIGEDLGKIGDVNQGFAGLQEQFGESRITDTGIRECTILGQGIGSAMRGLRPIVEIQYLDYIYYAIQIIADDLANVQYRTKGGQKAPVIIRTRGHRLEGIWHSGSPIGMLLGSMRGINLLVPRDMVQAAGFYNTMLKSDEPALIIECLNAYRLKEQLPDNPGEYTTPLGIPETIREGKDLTIVTYGSMCRIALEAADMLEEEGISAEVIDVRTLLPFDVNKEIVKSLKKTNRVIFADEDVPGGASAYMMQQVLELQGGYYWLDTAPKTISSHAHRPAYSSDGDYFSKPNTEDIFEGAYELMIESDPNSFPPLY
jgi:2-oxoisovalerate dehydrogenase E1 component